MNMKRVLIRGAIITAVGLSLGFQLATPTMASAARTFGPAVISVSPNSGSVSGGTTVTITGDALTLTTNVLFGGVQASFTIVSNSEIIAVSPAESAGAVTVKAAAGLNPGLGGATFTYS